MTERGTRVLVDCYPNAPRRIERFNDDRMARLQLGRHEAIRITGALGDPVQVWLFYPPGFDAKKTYPLLQVIHGGPHIMWRDTFFTRWNYHLIAGTDRIEVPVLIGAAAHLQGLVDPLGDVGRLLVQRDQHCRMVGIQPKLGGSIADLPDRFPGHSGRIDLGI